MRRSPTSATLIRLADLRCRRRTFLQSIAASAAGLAVASDVLAQPAQESVPVTGVANPALEPFDQATSAFLQEHKVPGAALAVTWKSKLVYARGFGYADVEKKEPVEPNALFRIASVSKPLTAVALMQLIAKEKISPDDKVTSLMKLEAFLPKGAKADPRWKQITVRQCLQHTGGWDREKSFDPIGRPLEIAKTLGIRPPVTPNHVIRYMMGQPLDFDPGERFAYSNLGYLILGRLIEVVTGQDYEAYVKREVLRPLGITAPQLGRALVENRAKGEVRYYDAKGRTAPALYPPRLGQQVPIQYGGENLEGFEAHGGWIASAVDLVRFAAAFDDPEKCLILGAKSIEEMWARPPGAAGLEADGKPKAAYYGCGWSVRPTGSAGGANTWHFGKISGTESVLVRRVGGLNWAVLFNTHHNPEGKSLSGLIDGRLHEAADKVKTWPEIDLFSNFLK